MFVRDNDQAGQKSLRQPVTPGEQQVWSIRTVQLWPFVRPSWQLVACISLFGLG